MYLMQMGEIPLLNRDEEVAAAKQIEAHAPPLPPQHAGQRLRAARAVELLEKVADGQLRLDRTIEVSVTNTAEKKRILKRLGPNLATLRTCCGRTRRDFPHRRQQAARRRREAAPPGAG